LGCLDDQLEIACKALSEVDSPEGEVDTTLTSLE
jgi:hypothetical protein